MTRVTRIDPIVFDGDPDSDAKRITVTAGECSFCGDELRDGKCSRACPASRRDAEKRVNRRD